MSRVQLIAEMGAYGRDRITRDEALDIFRRIEFILKSNSKRYALAGSYRRGKKDLGDVDIILADSNLSKVISEILDVLQVENIPRQGRILSSIVVNEFDKNLQVEFTVVDINNFGAALIHSTGSQFLNIGLRSRAKKLGYKLNQYGLFDRESNQLIAGRTEKSIFNELKLKTIPPNYRDIDDWNDFNRLVKRYKR